jgi:hypothetical protein
VRVKERIKGGRVGTIEGAAGTRLWNVRFDGQTTSEVTKSAVLKINDESYGAQPKSPTPNIRTVRKVEPRTGRRRNANIAIDDDDIEVQLEESSSEDSSGDGSSSSEDSSVVSDSDGDSSDSNAAAAATYKGKGKGKKNSKMFLDESSSNSYESDELSSEEEEDSYTTPKKKATSSIVSSISSSASRLFTPKSSRSSSSSRRLFDQDSSPQSIASVNDNVFIPEEGEGFDDSQEGEEDDACVGTKCVTFDEDGGERFDFIDEPQKAEKYNKAKKKYDKEKKKLIDKRHVFKVEVKSRNSYEVGGRVQGRQKSLFDKWYGTIIECLGDNRYLIEWDNNNNCEAKKSQLKLALEPNQKLRWKVVEDHTAQNPPSSYNDIGAIGFQFGLFNNLDRTSDDYAYPFSKLLLEMWPKTDEGDGWEEQLEKLNIAIIKHNETEKPKKKVKEVGIDEWWTFWGIIIYAAKLGKGGVTNLYDKSPMIIALLPNTNINLSEIMKKYRFEDLIRHMPSAFHGNDPSDPWNPVLALVNGFNECRARKFAASHIQVLDETMSGWSPTTTKYGGLPFLSFVQRKPTPLGTEFKSIACTATGKCLTRIDVEKLLTKRSLITTPYCNLSFRGLLAPGDTAGQVSHAGEEVFKITRWNCRLQHASD